MDRWWSGALEIGARVVVKCGKSVSAGMQEGWMRLVVDDQWSVVSENSMKRVMVVRCSMKEIGIDAEAKPMI